MAEYIWIDASGGIRSKSKVRTASSRPAHPPAPSLELRGLMAPAASLELWLLFFRCAFRPISWVLLFRHSTFQRPLPRVLPACSRHPFLLLLLLHLLHLPLIVYPAITPISSQLGFRGPAPAFSSCTIVFPVVDLGTTLCLVKSFANSPSCPDHLQESRKGRRTSRMEFRRLLHKPGAR